jgi:hypothetical protein
MSVDTAKVEVNQQKVKAALQSFAIPTEIQRWETKFGTDSTGDPAVWITFHVKPDVNVDAAKLKELDQFLSTVTSRLLQEDIAGFPYTLLEQAA